MKHKASLILLELPVMILVFALCAGLCLGCFAHADRISRETTLQDAAALLAQNTAETLKAGVPLPAVPETLTRSVTYLPTRIPGLAEAEISVFDRESQTLLIRFTLGWQEVSP